MDKVFIQGLLLRGRHGVGEEERQKAQEFIVDVSADIDLRIAGKSDRLEDTIDWVFFHDIARDAVENNSFYLIEKLADVIASKVLEHRRIARVEVTVCKKEALEGGLPGVTIVRTQA